MRLNKSPRKSRAWRKVGRKGDKSKKLSPEIVIGQVSPDVISTVLAPHLMDLASHTLEDYADALVKHDDLVREVKAAAGRPQAEEVHVPESPTAPFWKSQYQVDELNMVLKETSTFFFEKGGGWKVRVNAAKFERMLDEKYGMFRPFITQHPEVEHFIRSVQRKYAMGYFSPFRTGDPPIPRATTVILLFMMQRGNIRWEISVFSALFLLVGLQPWALVTIVAGVQMLVTRRKNRPVGSMKTHIPLVDSYYPNDSSNDNKRKYDMLLDPVGTPLQADEVIDSASYDTIVLGSGPDTLYTASLLSRAGRKVLVLSPRHDASGCLTLEQCSDPAVAKKYQHVPFDVEFSNIARISRQQEILAPALCTKSDCQGGIRFVQIGSKYDGYAYEILSIPGMGVDGGKEEIPFILRAAGGLATLMDDCSTYLGDGWADSDGGIGHSTTGGYVVACQSMNESSSLFYLSKILPDGVNRLRKTSTYEDSALRYASAFLNKCFPLNIHTRSLMAGMGMKGENLRPSLTSMAAHITNISAATSGEGMHYPVGGPRSLCRALANVIEQSGGRILTDVNVKEFLFDEHMEPSSQGAGTENEKEPHPPRCVGVRLADGREIQFSSSRYTSDQTDAPVVVSMQGFIRTFVHLLPDNIRTTFKVPRGLPALSERRPVFHVLFALNGSASELNVTGADYYRLPGAAVAIDEIDPETGTIKFGEIGWSAENNETPGTTDGGEGDMVESINKDTESEETNTKGDVGGDREKRKKGKSRVKFETGVSWLRIAFPSAKDPSFETRHGKTTTCVVTVEADDDFVTAFDTKPKLFVVSKEMSTTSGCLERLLARVEKDLLAIYPQLEGKVDHSEIRGPFQRGLSHNPERYAAKGVRADTPYPSLYVGGSDLTVGDSFSGSIVGGWLAANAVIGYSPVDHLFLKKNITTDLDQFLERPGYLEDDEAVAVPFVPHVHFDETADEVHEEHG